VSILVFLDLIFVDEIGLDWIEFVYWEIGLLKFCHYLSWSHFAPFPIKVILLLYYYVLGYLCPLKIWL